MNEPRRLPGGPQPQSVDEARRAVESQRARISATIDELEGRLVEKKTELRERLDVTRPVRDFTIAKPLLAVGIAAAAGALLGMIGGSDDDDDEEVIYVSKEPPPESKAGRLLRDMVHEMAGAATALIVAQLVERLQPPGE